MPLRCATKPRRRALDVGASASRFSSALHRCCCLLAFSMVMWALSGTYAPVAWAVPPAYHGGPAPQVPPFRPTLPPGILGPTKLQPALVGTPTTAVGTLPVLVILMDFSDAPAVTAPTNDPNYFEDMLFADDSALVTDATLVGSGPYTRQSLATWMAVESDGRLQLTGKVVGWLRAAEPRSYYARKNGSSNDGRFGLGNGFSLESLARGGSKVLVGEALTAAVAQGIDLSDFDWNKDGIVDAVFVVHAGPGAEMTNQRDDLWSFHNQDSYTIGDETWEVRYIVVPERFHCPVGLCSSTQDFPTGIGVYAHEFGHVLGLPDLNDTIDGFGIGDYGLMGWGLFRRSGFVPDTFGPDVEPIGFGLWSLERLGWITPKAVTANACGVSLAPAHTARDLRRIDLNETEYFLIGYTPQTQHYAGLPDRGLQVVHIDTDEVALTDLYNNQRSVCIPEAAGDCAQDRRYSVSIKQIDGRYDLERGNNFGDSGDLLDFGDVLDADGSPSSCAWAGPPCHAEVHMRGVAGAAARVNLIVDRNLVPEPPAFVRVPPTDAEVGTPYQYVPGLNAGAGDAVTFTVVGPAGMTVDAQSGVVNWTPTAPGRFDVTLIAENCGGATSQSWTIQVAASQGGCGVAPAGAGPGWPGFVVIAVALWWGRRRQPGKS